MTVEDVERRLNDIRAAQHDPEAAHGMEDSLLADVLKAIADGAPEAPSLARAALAAAEIDFPRWAA